MININEKAFSRLEKWLIPFPIGSSGSGDDFLCAVDGELAKFKITT